VTDAIYEAGFSSNSRFYETSNEVLGMTPSRFRGGGTGTDIYFAIGQCSLGSILVAQSDKGVCSILIGGRSQRLGARSSKAVSEGKLDRKRPLL
jgi:AraC family transcriptional regulator of adaptative response/methylated-DNA-[protein]-cysteine methyltransferase